MVSVPVSAQTGLFGADEYQRTGVSALTVQWQAMNARRVDPCQHYHELASVPASEAVGPAAGGPSASERTTCDTGRLERLRRAARAAAALPPLSRLQLINRTVNTIPYREDSVNYGRADYWATPAEFVARGGDCEDYAITKMALLRDAGIPASAMRIAIVRDLDLNASHAVLEVDLGTGRYVLDNQSRDLVPADKAGRYMPVYAVSDSGWWMFMPTS